jgi:hypothetical protein
MKNKKIYILIICLAVLLTGCELNFGGKKIEKSVKPEVKKETVVNIIATSSDKIATSTESKIASSTDDMSNWKTYSNKIIGIEFKYPPTWPSLKENYDHNMDSKPDRSNFYINLPDSSTLVVGGYNGLYPQNMPNSEFGCPKQLSNRETCKVRINKNEVRYVWVEFNTPFYGTDHSVFLSTGKRMVFFFFYGIENYNKRAGEYEKLLSSLKIIK